MDNIDQLISLNLEMEGLLRKVKEQPSEELRAMLLDRFEEYSVLFYDAFPLVCSSDIIVGEPFVIEEIDDAELPVSESEPEPVDNLEGTIEPVETESPLSCVETPADTIRVEEMISRREAKDLNKAFTLNDKYLFIRALFDGSRSEFADAINTIMAMQSLSEAQDYLYNELGWNPQSQTVKDFMAIVTNHFKGL